MLMRVLSNQALVAQTVGAGFHTNTLYKFSQVELVILFSRIIVLENYTVYLSKDPYCSVIYKYFSVLL